MKIKQIIFVALATLIAVFAVAKADTINSLSPFQIHNNVIAPIVTSSSFEIQSLGSAGNPCTTVNASGTFATSTCGTGGSSTISINGVSSTVFSLNSSTYLGITASGTAFTFTNLGVTSTVGNWAGTWQGVNSTTFYLASNPSNYISTSTYNASTSIATTAPLAGGGSITNGGTLTLTCSTCLTTGSTYVSTINGTGGAYNIYGGLGISVATGTASTTMSVNQAAALSFSALGNTTSTGNISASTLNVSTTAKIIGDTTIGSSSDNGLFSVVNASNTVALQVASTTNNAYALTVNGTSSLAGNTTVSNGNLGFATSSVSVSSCGTGSPTITGSNNAGALVTGTSASACTVTFTTPKWVNPPVCTVSDSNTTTVVDVSSISSSSVTFSLASALSAVNIYYICTGNPQ